MMQGDLQPQSGAGSHNKLDVRSRKITWSCKWTGKDTFTLNRSLLDENQSATMAPGGDGNIAGLAIRLEDLEDLVVFRAQDFIDLMKEEPIIAAEKADIRRAKSKIPQLLREIND